MNITKTDIDDLNAVISVEVSKKDYKEKVDEILEKYRKSAKVNGFRKGHIPMGLVRKQYGKAVRVDEVNRLLQENVSKYIIEQKLNLIASPLPKPSQIDWDAEVLTFEFEIGLAPDFELDLEKEKVLRYEILPSSRDIDVHVENMSNAYGETVPQEKVTEESIIVVSVNEIGEEGEQDKEEEIIMANVKSLANREKLIGAKPKDIVLLKAEDLAMEDVILNGIINREGETPNTNLSLEIKETYYKKPHPVNQELFDKVLGEGQVDSEEAFREKIAHDFEENYRKESDYYFFNSVIQTLLEQTKFGLPKDFLIRSAVQSNKEDKSEEALQEEYKNTEQFLRHHLIKSKLKDHYKIIISEEEINQKILKSLRSYMTMYNLPVDENRVSELSKNFLKDEKQRKQAEDNILVTKLTQVFKEKAKTEVKQVSLDEFLKETQEKQEVENV